MCCSRKRGKGKGNISEQRKGGDCTISESKSGVRSIKMAATKKKQGKARSGQALEMSEFYGWGRDKGAEGKSVRRHK